MTKEELRRYESLECYNHFASGWVEEVKIKTVFISSVEIVLVIGLVST